MLKVQQPAQGGYKAPGGFKTPVGSSHASGHRPEQYHYEPSPYAFDYAVSNYETGAEFAANENSDGKQTTGFYTVALPDGRIQTVKYTVDDYGGFNAEVSYEGEPSPGYKPAAEYKRAPTSYKSPPAYRSAPIYKGDIERKPGVGYKAPPKYSSNAEP
ncbi:cuticle protein 7-like [Pollicipes pollicipes]|uniref:cuticle protein 7-like n=1 Tax=Pollicipes pollicipes TaxID=41117 RepID=UPI0018851B41|nr:cuticle protein 7-like [Pollicipes pollicipes]